MRACPDCRANAPPSASVRASTISSARFAALALYILWYNLRRRDITIKTTLAVEAGLTDHEWTLTELLTELATLG